MQQVKTSGVIIRALLTSAIVVAGLIATLSAQSVAQETKSPTNLSALPPIESIDAKTDIRGFLLPGVPHVIHVTALRRAWSVNPAIRDFKEMAENDWDFSAASSVPGFGALDPDFNAARMAEQMLSVPRLTTAEQIGSIVRRASIAPTIRAGYWWELFSFVRK